MGGWRRCVTHRKPDRRTAIYGSPKAAFARLRGLDLIAADIDLGTGKAGEELEAVVKVHNISNHPIRLVGGTSDCSCTVVRDLPVTVEPGGTASVGIYLRISPTQSGSQTQTVTLRTDDSEQPSCGLRLGAESSDPAVVPVPFHEGECDGDVVRFRITTLGKLGGRLCDPRPADFVVSGSSG